MKSKKKSLIVTSALLALLIAFTAALNILSLTKFDNIFEKFFGSRPAGVRGDTMGADVEYYKSDFSSPSELYAYEVAKVAEIVEEFQKHGLFTKVLAASFKNAEQVHKCALCGCHSVTVPADILRSLITLPMTDGAIAGFDRDWASVYGDKTIRDL